jgi:hypothetical protein
MDDTPLNFLTESILERVSVPSGHGAETELLGENGIKTLKGKIVTLNLNSGLVTISSIYDSGDLGTVFFKNLSVLDLIRETNQKELVVTINTRVNNTL